MISALDLRRNFMRCMHLLRSLNIIIYMKNVLNLELKKRNRKTLLRQNSRHNLSSIFKKRKNAHHSQGKEKTLRSLTRKFHLIYRSLTLTIVRKLLIRVEKIHLRNHIQSYLVMAELLLSLKEVSKSIFSKTFSNHLKP